MIDKNRPFIIDKAKPWLNSPERAFLINCSRIEINKEIEENLRSLATLDLDWSRLTSKAERQGVAQFLYFHLSKWPEIWSAIPFELQERLKAFYYKVLANNFLIQEELKKVISSLNQANAAVIVLKGASLLGTVYKNISFRPMSDVDLLVKRGDLSKIKLILRDAGYEKPDKLDYESLEKFGGEIHLSKVRGLFLDIHSNLSQYERFENIFKIDLDNEIWAKSARYNIQGEEIRILNPSHLIMHLCMHHAVAHNFVGLFRFCDLRETILAFQKDLDWHDFIIKAECYKIKKIIYYSLMFTQELYGRIVPDDIINNLRPNRMHSILTDFFLTKSKILSLPDNEPIYKKSINQLFLMDSFLDVPRIIAKGMFPSDEWLKYRYRINKKVQLFFYRLFHPFITVFKILS